MDEYKNLGTESLSHYTRTQFMKRVTHLVLSVSLISLLFPHSLYWLSFLHSISLQLITHTIDKNCIFILCNGLLVLVVKNSSFRSSSKSKSGDEDESQMQPLRLQKRDPLMEGMKGDQAQEEIGMVEGAELVENGAQKEVEILGEDEEVRDIKVVVVENEEEKNAEGESSDETVMTENEEENYQEEDDDVDEVVAVAEDDNDDGDYQEEEGSYYDERVREENACLSTEELNKKFDEFIRKRKEELRIEARQHLVMVQEA